MIKKILKKNTHMYQFLCWLYAKKIFYTNYFASDIFKLKKLKGLHQGKRCFIIGNGPSLRAEDLDKIADEITFGLNRIYKIYDKTIWRPTYYVVSDSDLVKDLFSLKKVTAEPKLRFFPSNFRKEYTDKDQRDVLYNLKDCNPNGNPPPPFSDNPSKYMTQGYTVTYIALQLAVYMGFTEIYLTGIDFNTSIYRDCKGNIYRDNKIANHFFDNNPDVLDTPAIPNLELCELAYKEACKYADKHGIKIYNATRGGRLEVYKRIEFDNIPFNDNQKVD